MVLGDRQAFGLAIHRRARAEYKASDFEFFHRLEERNRPADVVVVIKKRLRDRLADRLEASEMQHRVDSLPGHRAIKRAAIADIHRVQLDFLPGELAQSLEDRRLRVREVGDDAHAMPRCCERDAGVRADIAESAGDENVQAQDLIRA